MNALFIGRFQPFHNGHLTVLRNIYKQYSKIIIAIGSSQYSHTLENPFSYDERKAMITSCLNKENILRYTIIPIADIHNPPKWVSHVESIISDFDVVFSNNPLTRKLFTEKGYRVKNTPLIKRELYSGSEIRNRIISKRPWENLVPEPVEKIIKEIHGVQRIQGLACSF
ncbi:MAG: nicotinamide-nucleotide adenylyltransferase [Thermoplasmatota archaeon]